MMNVPKKANDAMHLSMLADCDVDVDTLGEVSSAFPNAKITRADETFDIQKPLVHEEMCRV